MSNRPMSLSTEPEWESPQELSNEPPVDWQFPENMLTDLSGTMPNPSLEDTATDLQTQLADLQQQMERNESNENTIERTLLGEQLGESQEALLAELALATPEPEIAASQESASLPTREALIERANSLGLYDARFMGKMERDEQGNTIGQTLQALEVYQDANGLLSGKMLDVGYYTNEVQAEQDYSQLQNAIRDGDVPIYTVASMGEMLAQENGLDTVWQDAAPEDLALYQRHLGLYADAPSSTANIDRLATEAAGIASSEQTRISLEQDTLEQGQAIQALIAMGLQPPEDFNLRRDSFLDDETGKRYVPGIFQSDPANELSGNQAALIELGAQPDGMGQQASIVPVGMSGSYDVAERDWAAIQIALNEQGIGGAVQAMEQIETQIDTPDISEKVVEAPTTAQPESTMARSFDMDM